VVNVELYTVWLYIGDLALQTEDDITVSNKLVDMWARFAQTGSPTADGSWAPVGKNAVDGGIKYAVIDSKQVLLPRCIYMLYIYVARVVDPDWIRIH
jgi:hypothetical protein